MKKLLAIILALVMALSFATLAGCGEDESSGENNNSAGKESQSEPASIVGAWRCTIDLSEYLPTITSYLIENENADIPEGFNDLKLTVDYIWEFGDDEVTVTCDLNSYIKSVKKAKPELREIIKTAMEGKMIETGAEDMDIDKYISANTQFSSFDELMDWLMDYLEKMISDNSAKATTFAYELTDDEIALIGEKDGEKAEQKYKYALSDDELVLTKFVSGNSGNIFAKQLPVTFTRE